MMRIAVGAIMHESNTFASMKTSLAEFSPFQDLNLDERPMWRGHLAAGIVQTLKEEGAEVVPTLFGRALVGGTVESSAFEYMKSNLLKAVEDEAERLNGICLALHGSMYVEGTDDPEGELLEQLRRIVGNDIPIVCALDMHAKMTTRMLRAANAFAAYRTAPHVDTFETGARAARMITRSIKEGLTLSTEALRIPILICGEQSETNVSPMKDFIEWVRRAESRPGIVSVDYLLGFPWAETPHHGVTAVAVGEERHTKALREIAKEMAAVFWKRRHEFNYTTEAYPLEEALQAASLETLRPIVLSDTGDNPTAGAKEDLTIVLKRLLENDWSDALVAVIADQASWESCSRAGVGAIVGLELGRLDPASSKSPLEVEARVLRLQTVQSIPSCVIGIGGVKVVITQRRTAVIDPSFLTELGLDLTDYKLIVVKSGYLSPEYQQLAAKRLFALTPGDTNIDIATIPYRSVSRPIFPLDREMEFQSRWL